MPAYGQRREDKHKLAAAAAANDAVPSPVTPAVTGIDYPHDDGVSTGVDSSYRVLHPTGMGMYTHPNVAGSTLDDVEPPADARSLDQIWGSIRQEKERRMAKERPKVQSLEDAQGQNSATGMQVPLLESAPNSHPKSPRKQKSISNFRESTDGRSVVATFDLPDVNKQDIHISFQRNKLVLTWETAEVAEWEDEEGLVRDQVRKMFHRTLPLPEGTRFEEIHAQMTSKGLTVRYPNMRCYRVDARSSGDS